MESQTGKAGGTDSSLYPLPGVLGHSSILHEYKDPMGTQSSPNAAHINPLASGPAWKLRDHTVLKVFQRSILGKHW